MKITKLRKINNVLHRDLGYFFSSLIIIYSLSGLALNHIDDWNPDFIVKKDTINIPSNFNTANINKEKIIEISSSVGESSYKLYDIASKDKIKIYYSDASLQLDFDKMLGYYEAVEKRPLVYHVNVLHRNSLKHWKWVSDIFAIFLIVISVTGIFVLKGKSGVLGRGKWFILAGLLPPIVALILFTYL